MSPDANIAIRRFQPDDEVQVCALWGEAFGYSEARNAPALSLRLKLEFQPELLFVATSGERVVGTVMAGYDGHRGWIYSLAVSMECRRRGIGAKLVRHAEEALAGLGCTKVNLQVRSDNEAVVEFYKGLGFVVEPRISLGKPLV